MSQKLLLLTVTALLWFSLTDNALTAEKIVAGYSSISPAELTLVTASKARLFEKHGLDVSTIYLGGSTRIVQTMISGDVQIGQIGGSAVPFGKAAGADMAFIATVINSMAAHADHVATRDQAHRATLSAHSETPVSKISRTNGSLARLLFSSSTGVKTMGDTARPSRKSRMRRRTLAIRSKKRSL